MDTFKALVLDKKGEQSNLDIQHLQTSDLPDGDLTIRVAYSSVNFKDGMVAIQNQLVDSYPLIPGIDLAGTVIDSQNDRFNEGDEVIVTSYELGTGHSGGFSEVARVPADWAVPLPDGLSLKEAMILGTAGFTAGLSVQRLEDNGLEPQQGSVLVAGATGGVGSLAVNMLAKRGYDITASTGQTNENDYLNMLGANHIIDRHDVEDTDQKPVRKQQWAAAVDPVGGKTLQYMLSTLNYGGSVATSGLTGGTEITTSVLPFISRGINWLGIDSVKCPIAKRTEIWQRLADDLKPDMHQEMVNEVTLDDLPNVIQDIMESKVRGRTIVKM